MRRASWMSRGMMVTLFACMVQRLASSNSPTRCASAASCSAIMASACQRYSRRKKYVCTSRTSLGDKTRKKEKTHGTIITIILKKEEEEKEEEKEDEDEEEKEEGEEEEEEEEEEKEG